MSKNDNMSDVTEKAFRLPSLLRSDDHLTFEGKGMVI